MKSFTERNPLVIGAVGVAVVAAIVVAALQYQSLPLIRQGKTYSAYFADAGGLLSGADVEVSGFPAGKVSGIELDGAQVLVHFTVDKDVRMGESTDAAIKTKSLLGTKVLDVMPRGDGTADRAHSGERTTSSPYQLPDALGDLATTISGLDTDQLSASLATLSETFADTPPELQDRGAGRLALRRDAQRARRPVARPAGQRRTRPPGCWRSAAIRWSD